MQIGHRPDERLEGSPIQLSIVGFGNVDAKVGMDPSGTIGVEDEFASELETGVDAISFLGEVVAYYGDSIFVC